MLIVNQYNVIPIKEKNKKAQLDSLELSSSKVPYIRINRDAPARDPYTGFLYAGAPVPQSIEGKDFKEIKIEIGYFDIETQVLQPNEIKIGNVFVEEINYWEYTNAEGGIGHCYKFHLRGEDNGKFVYEHNGSIKLFFESILKKIIKEIESGIRFSEINIHFLKECSLDRDWDIHYKYFDPYYSILSMVYNCKLERKETFHSPYGSNYGITIEMESPYMYNPYIFWLLSKSIKDLEFVTIGKNRKYTGLVNSLPKYIEEELQLGDVIHPDYRNHVELGILSNIILNYKEDFCKQAWKCLTPSWESNEYITPKISSELYNQYCMTETEKQQIKNLAVNMLGAESGSDDNKVSSLLEEKYGIELEGFNNLVWDLMDYAPVMVRPDGGQAAHVLGSLIGSSERNKAFLAIVAKKAEQEEFDMQKNQFPS